MPNEGIYINRKITARQAELVFDRYRGSEFNFHTQQDEGYVNFISAIGHQATADALVNIFPGLNSVPVNRIAATMQQGDEAICLKILGRLEEGRILSITELEQIGFELYHVTNIGAAFNENGYVISSALGYLAKNGDSLPWTHKTAEQ